MTKFDIPILGERVLFQHDSRALDFSRWLYGTVEKLILDPDGQVREALVNFGEFTLVCNVNQLVMTTERATPEERHRIALMQAEPRKQESKVTEWARQHNRDTFAQEIGSVDCLTHIEDLIDISHGVSVVCGWHDGPDVGTATRLALIHSEISEALEADRKGAMDDKLPHRPAIEVELADALHRIFDLAGKLGLDLGGAYVEKARFNLRREDHKRENRQAAGGLRY